jgi:hypothetical protein
MSKRVKSKTKSRAKSEVSIDVLAGMIGRSLSRRVRSAAKTGAIPLRAALRGIVEQGLDIYVPPGKSKKSRLVKKEASSPALLVTGPNSISIKAGTAFNGRKFAKDTTLRVKKFIVGADYVVKVGKNSLGVVQAISAPKGSDILGGFHYAPGGNASANAGGDTTPTINPYSLWDINFRPSCDPRGMALIDMPGKKFWVDIYLMAADHLANGTSRYGAMIADGNALPENPNGDRFTRFDYATATAVAEHHGKALLAPEEFYAAANGVTEKSSNSADPSIAGLDAPRTSKFGLMQATGNMWVWGHDGTEQKRASLFGGSWFRGGGAGSRCASVACSWPEASNGYIGARGRGDHLQLG